MRELRQTFRSLRRDKGFTVIAVAMLALGIALTTAIFSVVNTVVLQSSYPDPDRLFLVDEIVPKLAAQFPADAFPVNGRHLVEWRKACTVCESFGLLLGRGGGANLTGDGPPERVSILSASYDLLPTLGVSPALGRTILPDDDERGAPPVLLLTDAFWRRRFQADPAIVGKDIRLDGKPHTVIGVLPPSFEMIGGDYLSEFQLLNQTYDAVAPARVRLTEVRPYGNFNCGVVVRLKPGASPERAADQMNAAIQPFVEEFDAEMTARLRPLNEAVLGSAANGLWMLLAAVGILLLIVCVNLGNLMLVRSERRGREAAVRRALGATTGRLLRQAFREGLVLAFFGGALGLLGAYWAVEALVLTAPLDTPRIADVDIDWTTLLFAAAITFVAALVTSVMAALRYARTASEGALRVSRNTVADSGARARARAAFVTLEVALSAVLLVLAGLVGVGFFHLLSVDRGFIAENVVSFDVVLPRQDYPVQGGARERFQEALLTRLQSLPGVVAAGLTNRLPLEGSTWVDGVTPEGAVQPEEERVLTEYRFVSAGYWRAMGVRLLSGRLLTEADREGGFAVISESVARKVWPAENAIGKRFFGGGGFAAKDSWEVVGVVEDVRTADLEQEAMPIAYLSYWKHPIHEMSYAVRTRANPSALADPIREAVWSVDPAMPVTNVRTMRDVLDKSVGQRRFQTLIVGLFAAAALLLAALGIYGVVSYAVARRTNEIGLRMALGAESSSVLGLVLGQGMRPVFLGLAAGLVAAAALGRFLESLLFEVSARDPLVFAGVAGLLLTVAMLACYIPARRAAQVDPMTALRHE